MSHRRHCPRRTPSSTTGTSWLPIKASWIHVCHSLSCNHQQETQGICRKDLSEIKGLRIAPEINYSINHSRLYIHRLKDRSLNHLVQGQNNCGRITRTLMALRCPLESVLQIRLLGNSPLTRALQCVS